MSDSIILDRLPEGVQITSGRPKDLGEVGVPSIAPRSFAMLRKTTRLGFGLDLIHIKRPSRARRNQMARRSHLNNPAQQLLPAGRRLKTTNRPTPVARPTGTAVRAPLRENAPSMRRDDRATINAASRPPVVAVSQRARLVIVCLLNNHRSSLRRALQGRCLRSAS